MNKHSIITADDHPLLLKGLNDFLLEKKYNVIGSGNNGREAYNLITKMDPDIAILDIQMPYMSGLEIAKNCKTNGLNTKIVLITLHKERDLYQKAQDLNIFGYILKEFALEEIENCINTVSSGEHYYSPKIMELLADDIPEDSALTDLTPSEKKILKLIAKDKTNKEIASLLFISYRTVEKHRSNIINKLKLEPKTNSLLIWAKEHHQKFF
ncbi:response regulator [Ulvibacter litoralis]|uniref:DNA-binding response regulator, NarL/FixJ family, contains REC and HTH domains n=1 Tax=Ulvibacter litoralis TaxID=227084 RepID=A0A1G7DP83_9FLAO|nr:response regulator transcription factor [Ulvibacter litoralis]GHC42765.1 DNA-binding response regulator [Ulvibacter litoralis]SDE53229.1 DNA-binding response regulator, NarL/FixJ family, contains REC and HTH domains [Ulvibacter litoralis]